MVEYWIVDPDARAVEVWRFAAGAVHPDVYGKRVPVRWRDEEIDAIELREIFPPEQDRA